MSVQLSSVLSRYKDGPLNLSGVKLGENIEDVIEFVGSKSIAALILDGCRISDKECAMIAEYLRKNETITFLSLRDNRIGSNGTKALTKALKSNKTCTHINLLGNRNIVGKSLDTLCDLYLSSGTLVSICGVWPAGIPSSREVHVSELCTADSQLISTEIGRDKSELMSLDLAGKEGDDPDYESIFRAIEFNSKLSSLSCSDFKLDGQQESFVSTFQEAFAANSTLETLTLIQEGAPSTYARGALGQLLKGLQANRGITTLRLDGFNTLSSEGDDSSLTQALTDMLKGNRSLLHLNLYREAFLDDNRADNTHKTEELVPLLAKGLGRSKLRVLRVTTVATPASTISDKKAATTRAFLTSFYKATDESASKRKPAKPLIIRFNDDDHLSGTAPAGREEVEYHDWEVHDQVHYIKDDANHEDSVPCRVMSVSERIDGKGADVNVFLHYGIQMLDSSFATKADVSPAGFVEMFAVDHRVRPFSLLSDPGQAEAAAAAAVIEVDADEEKGPPEIDDPKRKKKKKKKEEGEGEGEEGGKPKAKKGGKTATAADGGGMEKAAAVAGKAEATVTGYVEPAAEQLVAVRFFGDPKFHLAAVLQVQAGLGLADVVMMNGSEKREVVDETLVRSVDQVSHALPKDTDHSDKGFYRKNDVVWVTVEGSGKMISAKVTKVIAKKGIYDLAPEGEHGMEEMTRVSGARMSPHVPEGKKCLVVMGRNGHEQDGTSIHSVCEAGVVKAYTDSGEGLSCEVKLQSGRVVKPSVRQLLYFGRDKMREEAIADFETYSGLSVHKVQQAAGTAAAAAGTTGAGAATDGTDDKEKAGKVEPKKGKAEQQKPEPAAKPAAPAAAAQTPAQDGENAPAAAAAAAAAAKPKAAAAKTPKSNTGGPQKGEGEKKAAPVAAAARKDTPRPPAQQAPRVAAGGATSAARTPTKKGGGGLQDIAEAEAAAFDELAEAGRGVSKSNEQEPAAAASTMVGGALNSPVGNYVTAAGNTYMDSPEYRYGAGMQQQQQQQQQQAPRGPESEDHHNNHHAVILLGSFNERSSSIKANEHKPTFKRDFSVDVSGNNIGEIPSYVPQAHSNTYSRFSQQHWMMMQQPDDRFGDSDVLASATTRTPYRGMGMGEFEYSGSYQPLPPGYPRASNTAPARLRPQAQLQQRAVSSSSSSSSREEEADILLSTVDGFYHEIAAMQRALDVEAETLRKAMAVIESRKRGVPPGNYFLDDINNSSNNNGSSSSSNHYGSRFPPVPAGTSFDTSRIISPVKGPVGGFSFENSNSNSRYPAPITHRQQLPQQAGSSYAFFGSSAGAGAGFGATPGVAAPAPKAPVPSASNEQGGALAAGGAGVHGSVTHGRLSHTHIAGLVAIAGPKGMSSVESFVAAAFGEEPPSGASDEVIALLGSNGYDKTDPLDSLFSTLAEASAASSPVAFLRSNLDGHKDSQNQNEKALLLSGHAQKLLSVFAELLVDVEALMRYL